MLTPQETNQSNIILDIKQELINVLSLEASSITHLISNFPENAELLVHRIIEAKGKIVFTGGGKSGLVGKKLTATFASLGTPSMFLHPHDALHGDLGAVQQQDFVVIISKSGSGVEFEYLISFLRNQKTPHVLICCDRGPLASKAEIIVQLPFQREACTLNLAPTSSSTITMAFGDALAVAVSKARAFSKQDFARFHPAGALGKKLKQKVQNFMHVEDALPIVLADASIQEVVSIINEKKLGLSIVTDATKNLLGLITDGDIRRACNMGTEMFTKKAVDIMTMSPKTIEPTMHAGDALTFMEDFNITSLIVADKNKVVGLVHIHDIIKAGLKG